MTTTERVPKVGPWLVRVGPVVAGLLLFAFSACGPGLGAALANPGVRATVTTVSQWGQCLVDGGVPLHKLLAHVTGVGTNDRVTLIFATGDRFVVAHVSSSSPRAIADDNFARAHVSAGLARDPACATTKAIARHRAESLVLS